MATTTAAAACFCPPDYIYVYVDKPPPKSLSRSMRSVFSGRRAQVLHAVLLRNREWFGVKDIANQARVSPATASQVLTELEKFDWVVSRGQGPGKERHLQEPSALLDAWVNQQAVMRPLSMRRYFVPAARGEGLVERLAEVCDASKAEYAITHEAAGQRYAPFLSTVSQVRCRQLDGPAADRALDALDARVVDQGANLAVIEVKSPGELLFREFVNGIWLAGVVQVYLDLDAQRGPCQGNGQAPAARKDRLLMVKPATFDGYSDQYTVDCERVLVTLLRGLGPWKESVFLVGGLTPRYLVAARPPEVPPHAGTLDVDIVIDLQILADTAGYRTLEENLRSDEVRAVDERKRARGFLGGGRLAPKTAR